MPGITTWLTMAYILFVNPAILGFVRIPDLQPLGLPFAQVLTVTALVAGVMTILMGVVANYPFALAAGLGLNAFVAFTLVAANGLSFPQAMGVIVVEGVIITILVLTGVREAVLNAIPMDLKRAIGIGIGAFIALIGLVNAGVVTNTGPTPLGLAAELTTWPIGIFVVGLALSAALVARRVKGALLIGILVSTVLAIIVNEAKDLSIWGNGIAAIPDKIVDTPDFGLVGAFSFDFFTVLGTADRARGGALGDAVGLLRHDGHRDRPRRRDGRCSTRTAGCPGSNGSCWSTRSRRPPAAPPRRRRTPRSSRARRAISEGGRTGLVAVVVGVLFLLAMFFSPIAGVIPRGGDGAGARARRLLHDGARQGHLVVGPGDRHPGAAHDRDDALHVQHHQRRGRGVPLLRRDRGRCAASGGRSTRSCTSCAAIFAWYFVHGVV